MMRALRSSFVFVVAAVACGGEPPPQIVTPPPLHITAAPPKPPQRAHWIFSHPERGLVGKLDLGDGSTLYIGQNGRRELAKGSDPLVDAQTLALEDLIGVLRDPKGGFAFVAPDGDVYLAKEALGPIDAAMRQGPVGHDKPNPRLTTPTTGKSAIMGIHPDGRLMRSADFGMTWNAVDYAGANKPYGKPAAVVLDSKGNGVLLHFPQRLYATHDDGATWSPVATNHMGVRSISRDGQDHIFVSVYGYARAKVDGASLVATNEQPKPVYVAPPSSTPSESTVSPNERTEVKTLLAGDRVVELAEITRHGKVREIEIGSAALGDKIEKPVGNGDLVGAGGISKHIAAYGREIVYLRDDDSDSDDAAAATTTLFRSKDYGATWQKESQLQGIEAAEGESIDVAAGPKGWVYVTSLCPKDETSGTSCNHRQIRPAGATAFEDMAFVEEFEPKKFVFDEAHDKVFALGLREGRQYVYESPLAQNKFSRTKLLDAATYTKTDVTVDSKGMPRTFEFDSSKSAWVLHRRGDDGKMMPDLYAPLDRGSIVLVGSRGIVFAGHDKGWETNDGGENWIRIASSGFPNSTLECSEAGCINGDAQRVGWDLPALASAEKIASTTEPPPKPTTTPWVRPVAITPTEVTCKVSGTPSSISSTPGTDMVDGIAADRWASVKHETDSKISIVVGTKSAVRELPLLAALPKPPAKPPANPEELRTGERVLPDGVVAARYRFPPRSSTGTLNPVDVELAWWSAVTGRTQHKTLSKVPSFRVSRYGFSGTPQIVDGGLLFQGASNDVVNFIHDDGRVEPITIPRNASIREAERLTKRWVLADTEGGAVQLSSSDDNGKTWKQTAWGLDAWGTVSLTLIADKATISHGTSSTPALLFPVDPVLPDDPPTPVVIDNMSVDTACDTHAGRHRFTSYITTDRRSVRLHVDNVKGTDKWSTIMSPSNRVMHDTQNGKMCTSAYVLSGSDSRNYDYQTVFLYPGPNGAWSGWRFRRNEDRTKTGMVAEQLSCK